MDSFSDAFSGFEGNLCYNGNINTTDDYNSLLRQYPTLNSVMIGRGAITNPAIFREIKGGKPLSTCELIEFTDLLIEKYIPLLGSDIYTLHKLKEIWLYMAENFPSEKKTTKLIRKSNKLSELRKALDFLPALKEEKS